jgi:hypothetical protein
MNFLASELIRFGAEVEFREHQLMTVNGIPVTWGLDNRFSQNRPREEDRLMRFCLEKGGWALCSQLRDYLRLREQWGPHERLRWLPLAASPGFFPVRKEKSFDVGFVGYLRDPMRINVIQTLSERFHVAAVQGFFGEDARDLYNRSRVGVNIPTGLFQDTCYDVNMRVFEIAACGVPLVTNFLPELETLGFRHAENILWYRHPKEIPSLVQWCLDNPMDAEKMAGGALELVLSRHTYRHRARELLRLMGREVLPGDWEAIAEGMSRRTAEVIRGLSAEVKPGGSVVHMGHPSSGMLVALGWGLHPDASLICTEDGLDVQERLSLLRDLIPFGISVRWMVKDSLAGLSPEIVCLGGKDPAIWSKAESLWERLPHGCTILLHVSQGDIPHQGPLKGRVKWMNVGEGLWVAAKGERKG